MTDEDILIEYEAVLCSEGAAIKECPRCGIKTYRKSCPVCPDIEHLTGDKLADDLFARIDAGEDVDLNILRGNVSDEFETVIPGGMDG